MDGPKSAADLMRHLDNDASADSYIETVVGPDGKTRLIVYLKGVQDDLGDKISTVSEADGRTANLTPDVLNEEEAIRKALLKTPDGLKTEVALVGFSQGGMEAQLIADSGKFNVQNMVTYGSPLISKDNPNIYTTHIEAKGDHVVEGLQAVNQISRRGANPLGTLLADVSKWNKFFGAVSGTLTTNMHL